MPATGLGRLGRMTVVGVVSPGAMGSAVGRTWRDGGARVVATVTGRSERTRALAEGLELLPALADVVASSDVVVSICPPGEAVAVARSVLQAAQDASRRPLFADLNAISPTVVADIAALVGSAGLDLVDGSISGGPPRPGGSTTLYLSGERADQLAMLPADGLRSQVVGERTGTASAVKMCTASVYKGTTAVWIQALQTARRLGVLDVVLADLAEAYPDQVATAAGRLATAASKSGRFVAEMEQIALTQAAAGASPELFAGMAAVYARLARSRLGTMAPEDARELDDLVDVLDRLSD